MRKTTSPSSSSSPRPPRAPGVDKYGRSGLDSASFHSGKITTKTVLKADADNPPHRCRRCQHAPLVGSRCPSCGLDNRAHQLARDHRRQRQRHIDDNLSDDDDPDSAA